ncbi:uncharacterized protein PHALS_09103 [Plasmopara halstedii]|uniref:Uncharacterized protein n=1 Tax=Plasmopara halstedii TaxID=4781 RepID=A0A0P1AEG1_PLAHL|nr:uncharacterized protein PHALS_09103 [Plasmopara halstedii]CEG39038.1 hypothetical protein PHALS_09103 [Plasmopara halstedii]|eukprot:XP_024575407.1 hypothetical protein PHALS_09103 [Plasmopara halstedii]
MSLENDGSSSNSTSGDGSIEFPDTPKINASNSEDSCTWYSGGVCSRPRSCFDCLNVVVPGQECAVSAYGECMNSYMLSNVGGYPMNRFTYCSNNDALCSGCQENWIRDYQAGMALEANAVCVGDNGCICIAACVVPNRDDSIVENWCIPALAGTHFQLVAGLVAGTIALFVVSIVLAKRQLARRQQQDTANQEARNAANAARRAARRPAAVARLPQLTLSGWTGMREKLVSNEQIRLAGGSTTTVPSLATSSSVPSPTEEQGDAYREILPREDIIRREM